MFDCKDSLIIYANLYFYFIIRKFLSTFFYLIMKKIVNLHIVYIY